MPSPRARTVAASSIFTWTCHHHHGRIATSFLPRSHLPPRPSASASFSTTRPSQYAIVSRREPTYYDILNVPVTATPAEIKKSFYALSLLHHPDRNPTSPTTAAERFAQISAAYHVLSNPSKRAIYDRDNAIVASSMTKPGHQHPMGSYSSHSHAAHAGGGPGGPGGYTYAGSRPASGLSKRRGAFRGPPPSFYAHGGYGRQGAAAAGPGAAGPGTAPGGPGPGPGPSARRTSTSEEDPTSFIYNNPVHHFNAQGHFRTQSAEDVRRRQRRYREMRRQAEMEADAQNAAQGGGGVGDAVVRFVIVSGILFVAASVVAVFQSPMVQGVGFASSSSSSSSSSRSSAAAAAAAGGGAASSDYASKKNKES